MSDDDKKATYSKPTSTVDLETRQAEDYVNPAFISKGVDPVQESENGYVGVDPIYQSFSDSTQEPLHADGGPEAKVEADYQAEDMDTSIGATPEGESDAEDEVNKDEKRGANGGTPPTPSGPPAPRP